MGFWWSLLRARGPGPAALPRAGGHWDPRGPTLPSTPVGCSGSHHHRSQCCSQMGCFFRIFQRNLEERGKEGVTGQDVGYQRL